MSLNNIATQAARTGPLDMLLANARKNRMVISRQHNNNDNARTELEKHPPTRVEIEHYLASFRWDSSRKMTRLRELVIYLASVERWNDIELICGRVKFNQLELNGRSDNTTEQIESGIFVHLVDSLAPVEVLLALLDKIPNVVLRGNSGLSDLHLLLETNFEFIPLVNSYKVYEKILTSNPSAVNDMMYDRVPPIKCYPSLLSFVVRFASVRLTSVWSCANRLTRHAFIYHARQWRAIKEVIDKESYSTDKLILQIFPFLDYMTDLNKSTSAFGNIYTTPSLFKFLLLLKNRMIGSDKNKYDAKMFCKLLWDFCPSSVLHAQCELHPNEIWMPPEKDARGRRGFKPLTVDVYTCAELMTSIYQSLGLQFEFNQGFLLTL